MRLRLTALTLFILSLAATASGQQAKLEGEVSNIQGVPVSGVRVSAPGGQATTTDSKGHFTIYFNRLAPGQATRVWVTYWRVFDPMFGECWTQDVSRSVELLKVVIVSPGSAAAHIRRERLGAIVDEFKREINRQAKTIDALGRKVGKLEYERQKYAFLQKYEREYGVPVSELKTALDKWAQSKDAKDKLERVRQEYWEGDWDQVIGLTEDAGPFGVESFRQRNKQREQERIEDGRRIIEFYIYKGDAFYKKYKFKEALASFSTIERLFDAKELAKEDFTGEWAEVKGRLGVIKIGNA